jgi:CubicO group peptidase (beta-lactamase class C family)
LWKQVINIAEQGTLSMPRSLSQFLKGLLCGVAAFLAMATSSVEAVESLQSRIDSLVKPYIENNIVVSMTVGVLHRGTTTVCGYGRFSTDDDRQPDGDTVYEIGSATKVFTGVLLGDLVVRESVRLDQPAQELLPADVKMPIAGDRPITLLDLATHVSGLPRLPDNLKPSNLNDPYADYSVELLHQFLNDQQLAKAPGKASEYSNLGMGLLGHLLARRAELTYEQLFRERIAMPLKMHDTTITLADEQKRRLAPPHLADGTAATNWHLPTLAGAGAIRSTANDLLRFVQANLHPPDDTLGNAIDLAWKIHQPPLTEANFAMGLGWHVARDKSTRWHNVQTGGYHSMMLVNRQIDAGVVLLTNTATGEVDQLAEQIMQMLAGKNVEPRKFDKPVQVERAVMDRYVGKYELFPGFVLTVSIDDNKLMVAATGQPTLQVFARNETEWYYKVVEATLKFQVDADGKCDAVELFQNGKRLTGKRVD